MNIGCFVVVQHLMDLIHLLVLIKYIYLIGGWLGVDLRMYIIKTRV